MAERVHQPTTTQNASPPPPPPPVAGVAPPIVVNVSGNEKKKSFLRRVAESFVTTWAVRIVISLIFLGIPKWLPMLLAGLLFVTDPNHKALKETNDTIDQRLKTTFERVENTIKTGLAKAEQARKAAREKTDKAKEQAAENAEASILPLVQAELRDVREELSKARAELPPAPARPSFSVPIFQPKPVANAACHYCNETFHLEPDHVDQPVRCGSCYAHHDLGQAMLDHFRDLETPSYPSSSMSLPPPPLPPRGLGDRYKKEGTVLSPPLGKKERRAAPQTSMQASMFQFEPEDDYNASCPFCHRGLWVRSARERYRCAGCGNIYSGGTAIRLGAPRSRSFRPFSSR